MRAPKTIEEARALPQVDDFTSGKYFFGGQGFDGDSICAFVDADGYSKTVECVRRKIDGPYEWVKILIREGY